MALLDGPLLFASTKKTVLFCTGRAHLPPQLVSTSALPLAQHDQQLSAAAAGTSGNCGAAAPGVGMRGCRHAIAQLLVYLQAPSVQCIHQHLVQHVAVLLLVGEPPLFDSCLEAGGRLFRLSITLSALCVGLCHLAFVVKDAMGPLTII